MGKLLVLWSTRLVPWMAQIRAVLFGNVRSTISSIGIALTVAGSFEPLLLISRLASLLVKHWHNLLQNFWEFVLAFLPIQISLALAEFLTLIVLFVVLGLSSRSEPREGKPSRRLRIWTVLAAVSNLTVGFAYGMSTVFTSRLGTNSLPELLGMLVLLGVYLFAVAISNQISLAQKLLGAGMILGLIVALDKLSFALEWIVALARA